jgi:ADP-heptose:LPS heptosyltransferase
MGSTVLAYPAMEELRKQISGVELFFLVFKNNAAIVDVLDLMPSANIITVDYGSPYRLLVSGLQAMKRLLSEHIDTTIDMDFFSRLTALISFLVCRGNRIGFHHYNDEGLYRGNLLTHRVTYSPHIHTSAAFMALVRSLFENPGDEPHYRKQIDSADLIIPTYTPDQRDIRSVRTKLTAAGFRQEGNETIILINPNSSDIFPLRKWPLDSFAQLCQRLLIEMPHCWLVITGVASERKDAQFICDRLHSQRCIDFTGQTSFAELLALYGISSLMITNDSGPAHFAALLSLSTIVLFGPETPRLYSPMGNRHKAMYAELACSPCVSVYNSKKSPCMDNRCLKAIPPENVLREALAMLHSFPIENKATGSV